MFNSLKSRVAVLAIAAALSANAMAADVTGAGASFVYPAMSKWSADYAKASGKQVNYQSIGSGGGIAQIKAGTVDFGSSDAPLKPEDLAKSGLAQFPSVIGGIVPVVNLEGVAAYVKQIKGGIGYVELSYALQNRMAYSRMKNAAGNYIQPSDDSFAAAAASAEWGSSKDFYLVMTNAPGADSWPITATNFILMYKQPKNAAGAKGAKEFFRWVYANGDAQATALGYVPLPDVLVKQIEAYWSQNMAY